MIVVKGHRHAVVGEHQESQGSGADFFFRHEVAHQGLEKGFIGNPCGAEKAHNVAAAAGEVDDPFDGSAAQAPPLAADLDLYIAWDLAGEAQALLQIERGVEAPFLGAFVEEVAVDQPFFLHAGLDPVAFEIIKTFDVIDIVGIKEFMRIVGRFDRRAIPGQHVEMRCARELIDRGLDRVKRGLHQGPFAPAAFDTAFGEGDVGVFCQGFADFGEVFGIGAGVEVDRHIVTGCGEHIGLFDDRVRILVAQKYERNFCHARNSLPSFVLLFTLIVLNSP